MHSSFKIALGAVLISSALGVSARSAKDVVLDRVAAPVVSATPVSAPAQSDAMAVSVLVETPDGVLMPRSTQELFRTGDRFRIKVLSARDGTVQIYNTNPRGETKVDPIWKGEVKAGLETITARMRLEGNSGEDQLHIVLVPQQNTGVLAWMMGLIKGTNKDVRLDTQSTPTGTYVVNDNGQGLVTTVRISHL